LISHALKSSALALANNFNRSLLENSIPTNLYIYLRDAALIYQKHAYTAFIKKSLTPPTLHDGTAKKNKANIAPRIQ